MPADTVFRDMSSPRRGFSNGIGHDELAALADGSLPRERREELERRVAASPELAARLAEQRRAGAPPRGGGGGGGEPPRPPAPASSGSRSAARPRRGAWRSSSCLRPPRWPLPSGRSSSARTARPSATARP